MRFGDLKSGGGCLAVPVEGCAMGRLLTVPETGSQSIQSVGNDEALASSTARISKRYHCNSSVLNDEGRSSPVQTAEQEDLCLACIPRCPLSSSAVTGNKAVR